MTGVQRRLDLGRAGQRVRDEEEDIVRKLDKLIDEIEQQAQQMMQQQQQAAQQGQGQTPPQSTRPTHGRQSNRWALPGRATWIKVA